jgi:S1-C subfamily serine protease
VPITANVYQRVLRLSVPDGGTGTAFTLDYEGVQYLLTAEHVVAAQPHAVSMTLEAQGLTRDLTLSRLAGVSSGADIAVFRLDSPITQQLPVTPSFDQIVYTQDVYFLGFPYGMGLQRANIQLLPFVKKGILSASAETPEGRTSSTWTASTTLASRVDRWPSTRWAAMNRTSAA